MGFSFGCGCQPQGRHLPLALSAAVGVVQLIAYFTLASWILHVEPDMRPSNVSRRTTAAAQRLVHHVREQAPALAYDTFHTPRGWLFLTFVLFYFLAIAYLSHTNRRDPTSAFFDPQYGYDRRYSLQRHHEAETFIDKANASAPRPPRLNGLEMCIGIATIGRPGQQYVRATIGSLLEGLSDEERDEVSLITFVAQTDPHQHPIFGEPWLETLSDQVLSYDLPSEELAHIKNLERDRNYREKGVYDYAYVLDKCAATGAPWVTIIEDDTLAVVGWYQRATAAVRKIDSDRSKDKKWLYLRLFYTEEFLGRNSEDWLYYLANCCGVILLSALILVFARSFGYQNVITNLVLGTVCLVCVPAVILLYFLAGKLSVHRLTPGIHAMPQFGCCGQGFVFARRTAPLVVEHLRTKKVGFVDMLLEEWASEADLERWVVMPSLLQHIGSTSSKGDDFGGKAKHDRSVAEKIWNFGFELYDAKGHWNPSMPL